MAGLGICDVNSCLLCENAVEYHNHLFFQCEYSKQCLAKVKNWLGLRTCNLPQLVNWIQRRYKGSKFRRKVCSCWHFTVYKIWEERNNALWNSSMHTVEKVVKEIKHSVKCRVKSRNS